MILMMIVVMAEIPSMTNFEMLLERLNFHDGPLQW